VLRRTLRTVIEPRPQAVRGASPFITGVPPINDVVSELKSSAAEETRSRREDGR
jgi:hypothetical protein